MKTRERSKKIHQRKKQIYKRKKQLQRLELAACIAALAFVCAFFGTLIIGSIV